MSNLSKVPMAKEYKEVVRKRKDLTYRSRPPIASGKQTKRLQAAAAVFVEELMKVFADHIKEQRLIVNIRRTVIRERIFGNSEAIDPSDPGIPGDVLLYGHRGGSWTSRSELKEVLEKPFVTIQRKMYEKGWYVIEISDPEHEANHGNKKVYHNTVFKLYHERPDDKDRYFNKKDTLWHGNNMFPEDLS